MGRRSRQRARSTARSAPAVTDYTDHEGNVLTLRDTLSEATLRKLKEAGRPGSSLEDRWQRGGEMLFERLAVRWTIAGLPLEGQRELLSRYRMADSQTRRWVRETVENHLRRHHPSFEA